MRGATRTDKQRMCTNYLLTYFLDIIQIWERSEQGFRGFQGCGSVWLPMAPGQHHIDISLWKPTSGGLEGLSGTIPLLVLALAVIVLMFANPFPFRNRDANSHYPGPHGHARADHEPFSQVTDNHCHRRNSPAEFEHYLVWLQPVWCGNMLVHRLTFSDVVLSSVNTVTFYLWLYPTYARNFMCCMFVNKECWCVEDNFAFMTFRNV